MATAAFRRMNYEKTNNYNHHHFIVLFRVLGGKDLPQPDSQVSSGSSPDTIPTRNPAAINRPQ